jgi:hypothetical protein
VTAALATQMMTAAADIRIDRLIPENASGTLPDTDGANTSWMATNRRLNKQAIDVGGWRSIDGPELR